MKKALRVLAVIVMAAMLVTCFAGCGKKKSGAILIGGIGPLTGGAAIYGTAVKNAAELAVNEINALDDSIKFELKFEDDAHDPETSVNAYNTLKDWGMQILLGPVTSGPATSVSTEANSDRIFMFTPSGSSADVIGGYPDADGNVSIARKDNVFQMCFVDPNQGSASANYIKNQNLGTKIGVIYNNGDNYSTGIYQTFAAEAEKLGLDVASVTTFPSDDTTDFKTQLGEAKAAGVDVLFLPIYYTPASLILKQAKDLQYDVKFFGVDGMDGILTMKNFDTSLAEGVMLLTPFNADATDEKTVNFVKNYREKYGDIPNQFAADSYDCIYALYEACKSEGITADTSAKDICEKLIAKFCGNLEFNGLTGEHMTWSDAGTVTKDPKGMVIQNGAYVGMPE